MPQSRHGPAPRRAIFLDRDGVLNRNVWYADTGAWESPRLSCEFLLKDGVLPALALLAGAGFLLFVVSNQPNVVNGKSSQAELDAMHARLTGMLAAAGTPLTGAFYCCHHPRFTGPCRCRKPAPFFLLHAMREHRLEPDSCWMVGDRRTDMDCGRAAGVRTAWLQTGQESDEPARSLYDVHGGNLSTVAQQILGQMPQLNRGH